VFIKVHDPLECIHTRPTKSGVKPSISCDGAAHRFFLPSWSPPLIAAR